MVDIQVRPYHDLTSPKVQQNLLSKIARVDVILQCSSALHAVPSHVWFGQTERGRDLSGLIQCQEASTG